MCVRMVIGGSPVSIIDAEAEMPGGVPHELCRTTLDSVKEIIGLSITSGFSEEVHKRLGGRKGCNHLTSLILAMGTASLHGYWINKLRKRPPVYRSMDDFREQNKVVNSCKLWTEDGLMMQKLRKAIEKAGGNRDAARS